MICVVASIVIIVLIAWSLTKEGFLNPADAANKQSGDLLYIKTKLASIQMVNVDQIDTRLAELESKLADLNGKMLEWTKTEQVNNTMGYVQK